jgi:hypothetical protein
VAGSNGDGPKRREVYDFAALDPTAITVEIRTVKTVFEIEDLADWADEQGELPTDADTSITVSVVAMALDENGRKLGPVPIDTESQGGITGFGDLEEFARVKLPEMLADPEALEQIRAKLQEMRELGQRIG